MRAVAEADEHQLFLAIVAYQIVEIGSSQRQIDSGDEVNSVEPRNIHGASVKVEGV
jgi:hypothetical protein